jgi:uncharacterized membrane protein
MTRHPWHPAVVHFPIACWVLATLVDVSGWFIELPPIPGIVWAGVSHLLLWGGVLLAVPAIVAGVVDYIRLPEEVQESAELSRHVAAMAAAWLLFLGAAIWRVRSAPFAGAPSWGIMLLEVAGSACLIAGGRFAAAVVFDRIATAYSSRRDVRSAT